MGERQGTAEGRRPYRRRVPGERDAAFHNLLVIGLFLLAATMANPGTRALRNHRWYRQHVSDHPPRRKALVPRLV